LIKIRLQRKGRIRRPIYHIVVADSRSPRDGRIIEQVGRYDGVTEKKETILNEDRIMYWLDTGAQPTESVRKILRNEGVLYKRHLMMWGKSEAEIEAALTEWKAYRDSKTGNQATRKDKVRAALDAEEKEFNKQVENKAAAEAKQIAKEAAAESAVEETAEAADTEEVAEVETAKAETAQDVAETSSEEPAAEAVVEEAAEVTPIVEEATATEEVVVEPATGETPVEATEEVEVEAEAPVAAEEEKAPATEEPAAKTSADMTAKEAAEYISATNLADLEGFVSPTEERKTVLAAWESKKAE
jgi:small subunit ribosomal protein S16